ncbi:kinase-like domain-containing protein [Xylaria palmicola]|nr:kinase-like domain-containing protein [Xylaria palmicola]
MVFQRSAVSALVGKIRLSMKTEETPKTITLSRKERKLGGKARVEEVKFLAAGAYNSVWLVELDHPGEFSSLPGDTVDRFIIRLPCEDALLPNQVTNDVAFKRFVAENLPHVPVPKVYYYRATDRADTSYMVEEYINSSTLSSIWMSLTHTQKDNIAQQLANILVDMSEARFDMIGGLDARDLSSDPTVESGKLFKGRGQFHRDECYPIGPYKSTKEYILSCYDREIYYYSHAKDGVIDADLFTEVTVQDFVETLKQEREAFTTKDIDDEPFVLVHGDLNGRNILAQGDKITAILDWDFAGSYPLGEALTGGDLQVLEIDSEESYDETVAWESKIRRYIQDEVEKRGWEQSHINTLLGDGNAELGKARMEMFPE